MPDRYVQRGGDAYASAFRQLLPQGPAWSRRSDTRLGRFVRGLASLWGQVASLAAGLLLRESDPRYTVRMLSDWERAYGLPDPCVRTPTTIPERQLALVQRVTERGGQSRAYFLDVAERLGYAGTTITEYRPFVAGLSRAGDPTWQVGQHRIRYYWRVAVPDVRLTWFRAGAGVAGRDPHCRIAIADDLECVLRRIKPAHTQLIFDYSSGYQGWPNAWLDYWN